MSTAATGIGPQGDIVGDYSLTSVVDCCAVGTHGYLLSGGHFTSIDVPGSTFGYASQISPRGEIVGAYSNGVPLGFLLSGSNYITLDARSQFPGATFTNALGINPRGDVVGRYVLGGVSHGYLWNGGLFSTIDIPGAIFTGTAAINPGGDIVGRYRSADRVFHGFLLSKGHEDRGHDDKDQR
jgi:hypothetical protein